MDTKLIEKARMGCRSSVEQLLTQLQDPWFRFCMSLLNDVEKARDATQETALRFIRQLPMFKGQSKLMTWSMGIALNVTREMRRSRRMALLEDDAIANQFACNDGLPDQMCMVAENRQRVQQLIGELPERQREAVLLRFFEELSVEETASAMKCAQGTVKATIHQALRSLRTKLGQLI